MKQDPSKPAKFVLPRSRILRGKDAMDAVFQQGRSLSTGLVAFRYRLLPDRPGEFLIGFTARKKIGHAVVRNRLRRLLRESYRLNQHQFEAGPSSPGVHAVLAAQRADLDFATAMAAVEFLARQFSARLHPLSS